MDYKQNIEKKSTSEVLAIVMAKSSKLKYIMFSSLRMWVEIQRWLLALRAWFFVLGLELGIGFRLFGCWFLVVLLILFGLISNHL